MFEIQPWRPFRELSNLRREMDKVWEDFFGGGELVSTEGTWIPSIDLSETKDNLIIKAEVPGMDAKDIDISIAGDMLTIKGEKQRKTEEKDENYHRVETRYGSFSRMIRLPVSIDAEKATATYEKGVLKLVLPKKEEVKPKQIEIKTA
ncbi:Hsp20/alpha crystallin family protein [Dissulfurimicrobium hydrothermale]|uniref:Hsp20/alpha crystallin family protein n=1 Tax=Dissulfurimicrobium hydrothermale TaxID=1750598 RepID=UPI001EDB3192|nr:Hsp20/alpha crystallin family protein [Dissulfurimicrobium hydrothermale]UKL14389.1 Hsp20/alpha crystallin family protein [Dissulfurimicrobium hydrothermale]